MPVIDDIQASSNGTTFEQSDSGKTIHIYYKKINDKKLRRIIIMLM